MTWLPHFQSEDADSNASTMKETICAVGNLFALSAIDLSNMADNYSTAKGVEENPGEMEMRWAI